MDICSDSLGLHERIPRAFTTASTDMTPVYVKQIAQIFSGGCGEFWGVS